MWVPRSLVRYMFTTKLSRNGLIREHWKGRRDRRGNKDLKASRVFRVRKETREKQALPEYKALRVNRDPRDPQVLKAIKETRETLVRKVR